MAIALASIDKKLETIQDMQKEMLENKISKKTLVHFGQEDKKQIAKVQEDLKEYQLAVYLYADASFLFWKLCCCRIIVRILWVQFLQV